MRKLEPRGWPTHSPKEAKICLRALVEQGLADKISIGGGFGLLHYLDYRSTQDVDAWWAEDVRSPHQGAQPLSLLAAQKRQHRPPSHLLGGGQDGPEHYRIKVKGRLDKQWATWFEGMTITCEGGETMLTGSVADQSAYTECSIKYAI